MLEEMAQYFDVLEALQEHFLVIAYQNAHAALLAPFARAPDHSRAVRAAIDQIAQQDRSRLCRTGGGIIRLDSTDQRVKQIEPPVDVTHDIIPLASGYLRLEIGRAHV